MVRAEPIDYVPRAAGISQHANVFVIYLPTDDMEPRYERGDRLLVNPTLPIMAGKDVMLMSAVDAEGQQTALVRRLVGITPDQWRVKHYGDKPGTANESREKWPFCYRIEGARGR